MLRARRGETLADENLQLEGLSNATKPPSWKEIPLRPEAIQRAGSGLGMTLDLPDPPGGECVTCWDTMDTEYGMAEDDSRPLNTGAGLPHTALNTEPGQGDESPLKSGTPTRIRTSGRRLRRPPSTEGKSNDSEE